MGLSPLPLQIQHQLPAAAQQVALPDGAAAAAVGDCACAGRRGGNDSPSSSCLFAPPAHDYTQNLPDKILVLLFATACAVGRR